MKFAAAFVALVATVALANPVDLHPRFDGEEGDLVARGDAVPVVGQTVAQFCKDKCSRACKHVPKFLRGSCRSVCKAGCNAAAEEGEEFDPEADMATASAEKRSVEDGDLVARGSVVPLPGVVDPLVDLCKDKCGSLCSHIPSWFRGPCKSACNIACTAAAEEGQEFNPEAESTPAV